MTIDSGKVEQIIRHVANTEVLPRFKNLAAGDIREKNPGDFVTIADEASERLFNTLLTDLLPGSLIVGEEAVAKDADVLQKFSEGKDVWVVDPIDGTYNFSHGRSKFGILLSLVRDGEVRHGWAFDAPVNRMIAAEKGAGAFMDGVRLAVKDDGRPLSALKAQAGGAQAWHFDPLRTILADVVNIRCALHDFLAFVTGEADMVIHVNKITPWDHSANVLIAREAGGFVAVNDGEDYNPAYYGAGFLMATQSRAQWEMAYAEVYKQAAKKKRMSLF